MRILHLGKYYAPERGGIERYTEALAEACVRSGDAVAALVHQRPGRWRGTVEHLGGVEVRRAGCLAAPLYTPLSPTFPLALGGALDAFQPDILHLHFPNPSCFAALASPAARHRPWIVHWHADVPPDGPDWRLRAAYRLYRPFEQAVLRRAGAIVATSTAYLDASVALRPWRAKVEVIPLGIGPAALDAAATDAAPRWPPGTGLRLLAVGRLSHYKGFGVLLQALAQLPHARLLLVGSGECEAALHAQAAELGLGHRVEFAGSLDDGALHAAYAAADAFVLPSLDRSEAFGMVLLEAMRAGLPIVASRIPGSGVGEVVADGGSGLLAPPGDAAALASRIGELDDPQLRAGLGQVGFARWQANYTLERSAAAFRTLYQRVLASDTTA
ncbi:MAG: glycosyltransferase [Xanthomonadales bacterium]|nr:glycosyltransferase [Xanthomonadales bacterium]